MRDLQIWEEDHDGKKSTATALVMALVAFPADGLDVVIPADHQNPKLRNKDDIGVRNQYLIRFEPVSGVAAREFVAEVCAGDADRVDPITGGLVVKACAPPAAPVTCTPLATTATPRVPFGACVPYLCTYDLLLVDLRDEAGEEAVQLLEVVITLTPTLPGLTIVTQTEYLALLGYPGKVREAFLESMSADPSRTIVTIRETAVFAGDLGTAPQLIFEDGFESGDTAAWSATSP